GMKGRASRAPVSSRVARISRSLRTSTRSPARRLRTYPSRCLSVIRHLLGCNLSPHAAPLAEGYVHLGRYRLTEIVREIGSSMPRCSRAAARLRRCVSGIRHQQKQQDEGTTWCRGRVLFCRAPGSCVTPVTHIPRCSPVATQKSSIVMETARSLLICHGSAHLRRTERLHRREGVREGCSEMASASPTQDGFDRRR